MMSGLTIKEILEQIKNKQTNPKIILLTVVRYSKEEKKKIFSMGNIVDYIRKPFELDDLANRINKHIKK